LVCELRPEKMEEPVVAEVDVQEVEAVGKQPSNASEVKGKWYDQLFKKTKEWFEDEPDSDF